MNNFPDTPPNIAQGKLFLTTYLFIVPKFKFNWTSYSGWHPWTSVLNISTIFLRGEKPTSLCLLQTPFLKFRSCLTAAHWASIYLGIPVLACPTQIPLSSSFQTGSVKASMIPHSSKPEMQQLLWSVLLLTQPHLSYPIHWRVLTTLPPPTVWHLSPRPSLWSRASPGLWRPPADLPSPRLNHSQKEPSKPCPSPVEPH